MPTTISADQHFAAPPLQVFALFCDPEFMAAKLTASGGTKVVVAADSQPDGGVALQLDRTLPAKLPSVARRFVGETLQLNERQTWGAATADGGRLGHFKATIPGTPLTMTGTLHLSGDDSASEVQVRGQVSAGVPFVSGKIESITVEWVVKFLRKEEKVAAEWLAASET